MLVSRVCESLRNALPRYRASFHRITEEFRSMIYAKSSGSLHLNSFNGVQDVRSRSTKSSTLNPPLIY